MVLSRIVVLLIAGGLSLARASDCEFRFSLESGQQTGQQDNRIGACSTWVVQWSSNTADPPLSLLAYIDTGAGPGASPVYSSSFVGGSLGAFWGTSVVEANLPWVRIAAGTLPAGTHVRGIAYGYRQPVVSLDGKDDIVSVNRTGAGNVTLVTSFPNYRVVVHSLVIGCATAQLVTINAVGYSLPVWVPTSGTVVLPATSQPWIRSGYGASPGPGVDFTATTTAAGRCDITMSFRQQGVTGNWL